MTPDCAHWYAEFDLNALLDSQRREAEAALRAGALSKQVGTLITKCGEHEARAGIEMMRRIRSAKK